MADDTLFCATLTSFDTLLQQLPTVNPSWLLMETLPTGWVDEQGRANGIRLERFSGQASFLETKGRIFCPDFELRWERLGGTQIQFVYCGKSLSLNGFDAADELAQTKSAQHSYFLWGTKVQEDRLQLVGYPPNSILFAELQVPRLLEYPVSPAAQRVKLAIRTFHDDQHNLVYYRFHSLEEDCTPVGRSS
ncbi:MAG: hypothetical protein ACPG8W_15375 [Candidatus Promineifilaceae bacterium]